MATLTEIIELSSDSDDDVILIPSESETNGRNKENDGKKILLSNGNINIATTSSVSSDSGVQMAGSAVSQNNINSSNARKTAAKQLMDVIAPVVKKDEKEKIITKINKKLDLLAKNVVVHEDFQKLLLGKFEKATRNISSDSKKVWVELQSLFKILTPDKIKELNVDIKSKHAPPDPLSNTESKLRKKIIKLEKKLQELEGKINECDEAEVDLEDETNSAYLIKTRMINHYMRHWNMLCELQNFCKTNTGRPIHKKIPFEDVTKFPEINEAVFNHLNTKVTENSYYFPDFHDILNVVERVRDANAIFLDDSDVRDIAKNVFEHVVQLLQKRRLKDFHVAVKIGSLEEDPAEFDPDLLKKLEENRSQGRKEEDVIREFVKKQGEMRLEATEVVDENPDLSPYSSDTENEVDGDDDDDSESNIANGSGSETEFETNEPSQLKESKEDGADRDIDSDTEIHKNKKPRLDVT